MPRNRRLELIEESNGASGEVPEYGAIFMSNSSTKKECLKRELFGLPLYQAEFVKQVKIGMVLFLFEFESRELHGVFQACSDGAMNIEPNAFRSSGKQFPAQVKFIEMWRCRPLPESEFCYAICENYFTSKKFNFGLSKAQVQRLLMLFSSKKVERSRLTKIAGAKPTRKSESNLGSIADDRRFGNRSAGETYGDTSVGDLLGCRLTKNYGLGDESDIGVEYDSTKGSEYPGDTSGVFRRLVDPKMHGSKDIVGSEIHMNNSFGDDSVFNDQRVAKNFRHNASGWLDNEYHENEAIEMENSWSNHKEGLNFKVEPVVPAQSSVPLESPYGRSTEYYDPCEPGIFGNASRIRNRCVLREYIRPDGGYVSNTLPSETVQPFHEERNGAVMSKIRNVGLDDYIPMPIEHLEYQTNTAMNRVGCSVSEYETEPRHGHMRHFQFPGHLTSEEATENMKNFESLPYSSRNIYPSFADPLSSRDLSPYNGVNRETSAYQHQEEFGGQVSHSNTRTVRDGRIYPSFAHPPTSGYRADLHPENINQNKRQAYQQHVEFGSNAFDTNNRVIQVKDHLNPAELESKRTRKSVFNRLAMPSEERDAEKNTFQDTESVDEVMAFLNDCHKDWMEQKRPNMSNHEGFGKQKKKKEKIHTAEVLGNDLMPSFPETTPDDLLLREGSIEHSPQKLPFIDFKRRSKAQKNCGNPTQEWKNSPEHSAPQNKKRKILRPKLIEDDSEKNRGNIENVLASQSATEVPAMASLDEANNNHSYGVGNTKG